MNTQATATVDGIKPNKMGWGKKLLIAVAVIAVLLYGWSLSYEAGGSGQWELAIDEGGVKIYTLKEPGNPLIKVRAETKVKSNLTGIAHLIVDPASCDEGDCYDSKMIERVPTDNGFSSYNTFKYDFPAPLKTREYVVRLDLRQNRETKAIIAKITGTPDKLPLNDCCMRVPYIQNTWQIEPQGNGELAVSLTMDFDAGGNMPSWLANLGATFGTHEFFLTLQKILDKDKFQQAKIDYVSN